MTATLTLPFIEDLKYIGLWLIVSLVLILVDLRFGVNAAKVRGESIRKSRMIRRTVNKLVDYICWISIAWVIGRSFGQAFHIPLLATIMMFVVCSIELTSIFDNYFEIKGINKRFNVFKFLTKLFKLQALEESIEDKDDNDKSTK